MLQHILLSWPSNSSDCRISWSILWLLCKQLPSFLLKGKYTNIYEGLTPALLQQELFCMIGTAVEHRNKDTRPLCYKANIYCTQGQQNITRCQWLVISSPMVLTRWWWIHLPPGSPKPNMWPGAVLCGGRDQDVTDGFSASLSLPGSCLNYT